MLAHLYRGEMIKFVTSDRAIMITRIMTMLIRVQLDDQLLLDLRVDGGAGRERVDQDLHLGGDRLQPRWHAAGTGLGTSHDKRGELGGRPGRRFASS